MTMWVSGRLTLRHKLTLGFAVLLLPLTVQAVACVWWIAAMRENAAMMTTLSSEEARLSELQVLLLEQIRLQKNYVLSGDRSHLAEAAQLHDQAHKVLIGLREDAERLGQDTWLVQYNKGAAQIVEYKRAYVELVKLVQAGKRDAAAELSLSTLDHQASLMLKELRVLIQMAHLAVEKESGHAQSAAAEARRAMLLTSLAAFGLALFTAALLARHIARPLLGAVDAAERIASGDLREAVAVSSRDEVGRLQNAMAEMQRRLSIVIDQVRGGVLS